MWQKIDAGESTWDNAVVRAATITTGGYADWRLPTPTELLRSTRGPPSCATPP